MKERLKEALAGRERRILPRQVDGRLFRRAAVLLPIFEKEGVPHLLFEKRTTLVRDHKGEISFPGGAFQRRDGRLMATALRESEEEVGIRVGDVEVMGELDDVRVFTSRFVVSPFVGLIPHPYPFRLDPLEVETLIEVPLLAFISGVERWTQPGRPPHPGPIYFYKYRDEVIWGATAQMVKQLVELVGEKT